MEGLCWSVFQEVSSRRPGPPEGDLDRLLVAGVIMEVVLKKTGLPDAPQARRRQVKTLVLDTLLTHLAGWITLDRFRVLVRHLDQWVAYYYPLISPDGFLGADAHETGPTPAPLTRAGLREDLLDRWLHRHQGMLPRRPHRKFTGEKLGEFLRETQGSWFRLKDFEQYFHLDRKTAWEYLRKLHLAGLLTHNQKRSSAARYSLAPTFLKVRADTLRVRVSLALTDFSPNLSAQAADCLIATGGEPFWAEQWGALGPVTCRQEILARLEAASLLEIVWQSGPSKMCRLLPQWLQDNEG